MWTTVAILVVILVAALWVLSRFNALVRAGHESENAWSQVEVQLQRRLDLIPNLVETVRGLSLHEKETLQKVVEARGAAMGAAGRQVRIDTEASLSRVLADLRTIVENYPQLRADAGFLRLQDQLAQTEEMIARSRQFYNDSVMRLKSLQEEFPGAMIAGISGRSEPPPLFKAADDAKSAPVVSFRD